MSGGIPAAVPLLASAINYMAAGSYVNRSVRRSWAEWECMVAEWTCVRQNPLVIHLPAKYNVIRVEERLRTVGRSDQDGRRMTR
jgi:hypothetical protein